MPEKNLSTSYLYEGIYYGPGKTEIPQKILDSDALSPAFAAELKGEDKPPTGEQGESASQTNPGEGTEGTAEDAVTGDSGEGSEDSEEGETSEGPSEGSGSAPDTEQTPVEIPGDLDDLSLSEDIKRDLRGAGYLTKDSLNSATDDQLDAVPSIGPARIRQIREALAADPTVPASQNE
jgi:hypothetical protein